MVTTDTSRCVKCGLCLAECPTYRLTGSEASSPRGRIALVQALEANRLAPSSRSRELLGSCLLCRRCERLCPSEVPFGKILDHGRVRVRRFLPLRERAAAALLSRPGLAHGLLGLAAPLRRLLPKGSRFSGLLGRREAGRHPLAARYPAQGKRQGTVGLFTGCSGRLLDAEALRSAVRILTRAGFEVHVPPDQACCGALDLHSGNQERAQRLRQRNLAAFGVIEGLDAVVSLASGCGAHLAGYPEERFRHRDLCDLLWRSGAAESLRFRSLPGRALVHTPCTLENVLGQGDAVFRLLELVPGLEVEELGSRGGCCGAGGLAFLSFPGMSRRLRQPLVEQVEAAAPRFVVTSNAACGLHLQQGAGEPEYLHPVTLLARQLASE